MSLKSLVFYVSEKLIGSIFTASKKPELVSQPKGSLREKVWRHEVDVHWSVWPLPFLNASPGSTDTLNYKMGLELTLTVSPVLFEDHNRP